MKAFYYLAIAMIHLYVMNYMMTTFPIPAWKHFTFLTNISFFLNLAYFVYMSLVELKLLKGGHPFENSYVKFAFSIAFVVFTMFWFMMSIEPTLLAKKGFYMPTALNYFLHGFNFVFIIMEHLFIQPREDCPKIGLKVYLIFAVCYMGLLQTLHHLFQVTVYPFVATLPFHYLMAVVVASVVMCLIGNTAYQKTLKKKKIKAN